MHLQFGAENNNTVKDKAHSCQRPRRRRPVSVSHRSRPYTGACTGAGCPCYPPASTHSFDGSAPSCHVHNPNTRSWDNERGDLAFPRASCFSTSSPCPKLATRVRPKPCARARSPCSLSSSRRPRPPTSSRRWPRTRHSRSRTRSSAFPRPHTDHTPTTPHAHSPRSHCAHVARTRQGWRRAQRQGSWRSDATHERGADGQARRCRGSALGWSRRHHSGKGRLHSDARRWLPGPGRDCKGAHQARS